MSATGGIGDEVWLPVPSCEHFLASSWGRVKIHPPIERPMPNGGTRVYNPQPTYGYEEKSATGRPGVPKRRVIRLNRDGKNYKIARLVCEAFHGPPPEPRSVTIHIDENPANNLPSNLKWGTQKENLNMPKVKEYHRSRTGENHPHRKATLKRGD